MAIGSLWKEEEKFVIQFNKVKPKEKSLIFKTLTDWKKTGSGFHRDGTEVYLFSNTLYDEEKVFSLVKSLPFPFTEEKKNGQSKTIKTEYDREAKRQRLTEKANCAKIRGGKRSCSKCGAKGHNSRTCKA